MAIVVDSQASKNLDVSSRKEWILTNGIGGFAMGTVAGQNTRRYHGHLVAATTPPATRMVLLAAIDATVQTDGNPIGISTNQYPGTIFPQGYLFQQECIVGEAIAWTFKVGNVVVQKRLRMHQGENTVTIEYSNRGDEPFLLTLRPLVSHKFYHANFYEDGSYPQSLSFPKDGTVIEHHGVTLFLTHRKAQRLPVQGWYYRFEHVRELERGLDSRDDLFCPCELRYELAPGEVATLIASTSPKVKALPEMGVEMQDGFKLTPLLRKAVQKFVVATSDRTTIIAGYPWFTDWGRDTMISIPGALLQTGSYQQARAILKAFGEQRFQGLIPNRFVELGAKPDYNTVDATLWFANAIYKTLLAEWHHEFAIEMADVLADLIEWHTKGTLFGIRVDPTDGLLTQGEDGVQLTWMDAKVGDWVVTPRHGKPVEVNGLWINALRIMEWLGEKLGRESDQYRTAAEFAEMSFELKFWHELRGHYLDTVEPDDASLRPNQVISMALPFSPAAGIKARRALDVVARELLTPTGLRTLGPNEPGYRGRYEGPMPELDAAYHQGTAWPWLLGPYVTAMMKLTGDKQEAKRILKAAKSMLQEYGLNGIAEVYDGDIPQRPNGCPWQAWSAAEMLRAWQEDCGGD